MATQIACAAQGRSGVFVECFRELRLPELSCAGRVFLVGLQPPSEVAPEAFAHLRAQLTAQWREVGNPRELHGLQDLQVLTFVPR